MNQTTPTHHPRDPRNKLTAVSSEPLSILITCGIFAPDIGGTVTWVEKFIGRLQARGHRVTVITRSDVPSHPIDQALGCKVLRLPRSQSAVTRVGQAVSAMVKLGRGCDAIFVVGMFLEAVLANRVLRKPLLGRVPGDLAWEMSEERGWCSPCYSEFRARRQSLPAEALRALRGWWSRAADKIIVPSRFLASVAPDWGVDPAKVEVIYNQVPVVHSRFGPQATSPLTTDLKLVWAGRLVGLKRVDKILIALAAIDNAGLLVIGGGPERQRLENLSSGLGLGGRVVFTGALEPHRVLEMLGGHHALVLYSTMETLATVAIEAMSRGLPVVAPAVGGLPEVVRHGYNGLLVAPDDMAGLARAMSLMADEELRMRLSRGAKAIAAGFNQGNSLDRYTAIVEELAARSR